MLNPNPTPAHVAALAALFGITPETHRHLYIPNYQRPYGFRLEAPDPLGPDADGVWLAPAMWYLEKKYTYVKSWSYANGYGAEIAGYDASGDTRTAALLQACLAARVPEVCRAMGGGK